MMAGVGGDWDGGPLLSTSRPGVGARACVGGAKWVGHDRCVCFQIEIGSWEN